MRKITPYLFIFYRVFFMYLKFINFDYFDCCSFLHAYENKATKRIKSSIKVKKQDTQNTDTLNKNLSAHE